MYCRALRSACTVLPSTSCFWISPAGARVLQHEKGNIIVGGLLELRRSPLLAKNFPTSSRSASVTDAPYAVQLFIPMIGVRHKPSLSASAAPCKISSCVRIFIAIAAGIAEMRRGDCTRRAPHAVPTACPGGRPAARPSIPRPRRRRASQLRMRLQHQQCPDCKSSGAQNS
eukprot:COSAG02_NODE_66_length_42609_cov_95.996848_18_plen_171_part_00